MSLRRFSDGYSCQARLRPFYQNTSNTSNLGNINGMVVFYPKINIKGDKTSVSLKGKLKQFIHLCYSRRAKNDQE